MDRESLGGPPPLPFVNARAAVTQPRPRRLQLNAALVFGSGSEEERLLFCGWKICGMSAVSEKRPRPTG